MAKYVLKTNLSFIGARPKAFFAKDTKFWILLITSTFTILGGLSGALYYKSQSIKEETNATIEARKNYSKKLIETRNEFEILKSDVTYAKTILTGNEILMGSLANLFAIVPDAITFEKVQLTESCLTLIGTTPTKELYNLQLSPALKSVFTKSEVSFIPKAPGKVQFISINTLDTNNNEVTPDETTH